METFQVEASFTVSDKIASGNIYTKVKNLLKTIGTDVIIKKIVSANGNPTIDINIELFGSVRVLGGFSFKNSKGKEIVNVIVDEGASHLLFELNNSEKKAYFHGALTGLENERFFNTKPGGFFSYYRRKYKKLKEIYLFKLIDQSTVYSYDTAEKQESPRRKVATNV